MGRKNWEKLVYIILAACLLMTGGALQSRAQGVVQQTEEAAGEDSIRIGLLFSQTGSSSGVERSMINAARMAFDEINETGGINGKRIEYILEDYSSDPALAEEKITKLIAGDRVAATVGCYSSASRKATLSVLEEYGSVLVYPAYTEGNECDPHVIYTGSMPNQQSEGYIRWLLQKEGKKVYLVGNDYLYPVTYNKIAKEIIDAQGGSIVGEAYVKTGEIAFDDILRDIAEKNPDFIYCDLIGDSLTAFYTSFQKMGFDSSDYPIASVTTDEMVLKQIGAECGEGHYSAMSYFSSVDSAAGRAFVEEYEKRVEDSSVITGLAESAYNSCYLLAGALAKVDDPYDYEELTAAFSNLEFDAPQGKIHVDAQNHGTWLYSRFAVIHNGAFEILYESDAPIAPDPGVDGGERWRSRIAVDETYDVYWMPLLVLPVVCALFYGGGTIRSGGKRFDGKKPDEKKRAWGKSAAAAAAAAQPFFLTPYHGYANVIPCLIIIVWALGLYALGSRQGEEDRKKQPAMRVAAGYAFMISLALLYICVGRPLYHFAARFHDSYYRYAFSWLPDNIINANLIVLVEMLCLLFLLYDLLCTLPLFRRAEKKQGYGRHMYVLFLLTAVCAVLAAVVSADADGGQLLYISVSVNAYQSRLGNTQLLLLKEMLVWGAGCLLAHYLDYYYAQQSDRLEMARTQRAIFESSSDMIWSISGQRGSIVTTNQAARAFFASKGADGKELFLDIWDKSELDQWTDCIEKAQEKGEYRTDYYNAAARRYYNLTVHRVDLNAQEYDIAFFAKDVTEETELNDRLQSMHDELENRILEKTRSLEEANKSLGRFSYMVAHELKAPIRAIRLYNELRGQPQEALEEASEEACAAHIDAYCAKSIELINGLLEYTKSQETDLSYARINMKHLVKRQIEEHISMSGLHNVEYKIGFLPNITGDEALMNCCVSNIIANALKYSAMRERILLQVESRQAGQEWVFYFRDNGIGFPGEQAGKVFEMFGRLHSDAEFEGTGVGLATVKNIIERHGGWVRAESEPGAGCTIVFGVPG